MILATKIFQKFRRPNVKSFVVDGHKKLIRFKKEINRSQPKTTPSYAWVILIWVRGHGKHLSLFLVAAIVLLSNLFATEPKISAGIETPIDMELITKPPRETVDLAVTVKTLAFYTPVAKGDPREIAKKITSEVKLVTSGESFLVKPAVLGVRTARAASSSSSESSVRGWYQSYQVKRGESVGSIANQFGISAATILSANNIPNADLVKPGTWIRVPVKNGVMHTVARGENLSGLVSYYKGDFSQTLSTNNLKGNNGQTIYAGQRLFIVDGKKPATTHLASRGSSSASTASSSVASRPRYAGSGHRFPYGYCTWYVATKRYVPWGGNANRWLYNARAYGYSTGRTPRVGAIMVTHESWWGHVAYVEAVHGNSVTISEMNYAGWGKVNYRTLSAWYGQYIY